MAGFSGAVEGGVLHQSDIVNRRDSTATDKPLSAAQGKALNDKITKVYINSNYRNNVHIYAIGSIVYICSFDNLSDTILTGITIPSQYRPSYNISISMLYYDGSSYKNGFVVISNTGRILVKDYNYSNVTSNFIRVNGFWDIAD